MAGTIYIDLAVDKFAATLGECWQPIETAPRSQVIDGSIVGCYLLLWTPADPEIDGDDADPQTGIQVGWWEPLMGDGRGGKGCWYSGLARIQPVAWMPLPRAPQWLRLPPLPAAALGAPGLLVDRTPVEG
jgi:hypothetical protein